jgi:pimeloyl-ACP methyl ester carboxylesterase
LAFLAVRAVHALAGGVTRSFVDVVRYLDRSPRSYARRREIREGMVELLQALHDKGRYSRVIVVAHSLGGYIAYDGLVSLWSRMAKLHAGPIAEGDAQPLEGLDDLEEAAKAVHDSTDGAEPTAYRAAQFALWQGLRKQGNPWLVTDFVTLGTPMYFADLLFTKDRTAFETAVRTGVTPSCPPRAGTQMVEAQDSGVGHYGWNNHGRTVLHHAAPFAVTRWTNLFFPVKGYLLGDWFGGPLQPLFGRGVWDREVLGNTPGRLAPAMAHGKYFSYPDDDSADGIAKVLQEVLELHLEDELAVSRDAPAPLPATDVTY